MCWAQLQCGMRSGSSLQGAAGWCSRVAFSQKLDPFLGFVLSQRRRVRVPDPPVLVAKGFQQKGKELGGDGQESECGEGGKGVQGEAVASSDEKNKQLLLHISCGARLWGEVSGKDPNIIFC